MQQRDRMLKLVLDPGLARNRKMQGAQLRRSEFGMLLPIAP
jgi:hypothetical protein